MKTVQKTRGAAQHGVSLTSSVSWFSGLHAPSADDVEEVRSTLSFFFESLDLDVEAWKRWHLYCGLIELCFDPGIHFNNVS